MDVSSKDHAVHKVEVRDAQSCASKCNFELLMSTIKLCEPPVNQCHEMTRFYETRIYWDHILLYFSKFVFHYGMNELKTMIILLLILMYYSECEI